MPSLEDLVKQGYKGGILTDADRARLAEQLMGGQRAEIERVQGDLARQINEGTFGRGLGLSTVTRDLQSERERIRQETLVKAERESQIAARQAQAAALGQAAQYATARQGQALQQQQFGQQAEQFKQGMGAQQSMARQQMLGGGLAGLTGAGLKTAGYLHGTGKAPWQTPTPPTPGVQGYGEAAQLGGLAAPSTPAEVASMTPGLPALTGFAEPSMAPFDFGPEPSYDFGGFAPSMSFDPNAFDLSGLWDLGGWDPGQLTTGLDLENLGGGWW